MSAVPFDTLKMARKLEATGVERSVAWGIVDGVVAALAEARPADRRGAGPVLEPVGPSAGNGLGDHSSRVRRDFTVQLGGLFVLWTWITLLGVSYLLHYR